MRNDGWTLRTVAAGCGLCGGIGVGVLGSIISAVAWFTGPEWHGHLLQRDGTILLFLTIPLLIFGAHCLDLVDRQKTKNQKSRLVLIAFLLLSGASVADAQELVNERERLLLERIDRLERRLTELETRIPQTKTDPTPSSEVPQATTVASNFLDDTTFNVTLDGYYGYNFNRPIGGINLLRAYDVSSNSFSLNQAAIVIENAPNLEKGKRYGLRLDLQYGQATETVQGNAANEPRPQVYRNLWQAYGTYVFDAGSGLTVDFGKFSSALGYETNYTKDNFNYSRSYWFNFLPFYHFGFRSTYALNKKLTLTHWLVNGVQQSEDFNGFKSQALLLTWKPTAKITSQFNYYNGQEQRDQKRPVPSGRLHVLDTYHTFVLNDKWTLAVEGDYVAGRVFRDSPPSTVWGGAGYARYQWTPKFALAGRIEYLSEKVSPAGGLFSGVNQALKEHTLTAEYKFAEGFLGRLEYRRDFSNQPFFLTERPGVLKKEQNTATLGLVWWFGRKEGTW